MGCPGGCIGGGGQPYARAGEGMPLDIENLKKRAEALRSIDRSKVLKCSYENPDVIRVYQGIPWRAAERANRIAFCTRTINRDCRRASGTRM